MLGFIMCEIGSHGKILKREDIKHMFYVLKSSLCTCMDRFKGNKKLKE